jgi:hypothetical protein
MCVKKTYPYGWDSRGLKFDCSVDEWKPHVHKKDSVLLHVISGSILFCFISSWLVIFDHSHKWLQWVCFSMLSLVLSDMGSYATEETDWFHICSVSCVHRSVGFWIAAYLGQSEWKTTWCLSGACFLGTEMVTIARWTPSGWYWCWWLASSVSCLTRFFNMFLSTCNRSDPVTSWPWNNYMEPAFNVSVVLSRW